MKKIKIVSVILAAVMLFGLLPLTAASAGTEYDLKIAGVTVTETNKNDILGDGAFSYDPDTNTLTVKGDCNCESKGVTPIINNISGLTVYVANDVTLRSGKTGTDNAEEESGLLTYVPLTITGPGMLKLIANGDGINGGGAWWRRGTRVTIDDGRVDVKAKCGMVYINGLVLKSCYLHVSAGEEAGTVRCFNLSMTDCMRIKPKNGSYNSMTGEILDEKGFIASEFTIAKVYDISIAGTIVTRENKDDILGNGAASYDSDKNVLTLKKSIGRDDDVINNSIPDLTIYVANDLTLESGWNDTAIGTDENITITGPGLLKLRGGYGIRASGFTDTVTLDRVCIDSDTTWGIATYAGYGIDNGDSGNLVIRNSYLRSVSDEDAWHSQSAIHRMSMTFDGCGIVQPEGAYYRYSSLYMPDGTFCYDVTINGIYDLWIDNSQATARNAYNLTGTGEFAYNADENVLYIKDTHYSYPNLDTIRNGIPNLEIRAEKKATLSSYGYAMVIEADTTITGGNELTLIAGTHTGIFVRDGATLTVKNTKLNVKGEYGIMGISSASGEKLVIEASNVNVTATGMGVFNFADITLDKCTLTLPDGGRIRDGDILESNGTYAKNVKIETVGYEVYINGIQIKASERTDVFGDGTVRFYDKGEYTPTELDLKYGYDETWFKNTRVLVLDNYKNNRFYQYPLGSENAAHLYIDDDIFVVLKGENVFFNRCECHGIYIDDDYVHFIGDGSLKIDSSYYEYDALHGEDTCVYFGEEVNVELIGKRGAYLKFRTDPTEFTVEDNAKVICKSRHDTIDYPGLVCSYSYVENHGELICEGGFDSAGMDTWRETPFYNKFYDIKILKAKEFVFEPYTPEVGIDVTDGVKSYDCRYVDIKGKTAYAETARFNYDTYKVTPEKNNIRINFWAGPSYAPELDYSDVRWTSSDNTVASAVPVSQSAAIVTGYKNGTTTVTVKMKGGATASCTVIAEGFDDPLTLINKVLVYGYESPEPGDDAETNLSSVYVPDDAPYYISDVYWTTDGASRFTGKFEKGKRYYMIFEIKPESGYYLNPGAMPNTYVNGSSSRVNNSMRRVEDGTYHFNLYNEYPGCIYEVSVNGYEEPEAGDSVEANLSKIYAPVSEHYYVCGIAWCTTDGGGVDSAFEAGREYYLRIDFAAKDEDHYFENSYYPNVFVNGKTPKLTSRSIKNGIFSVALSTIQIEGETVTYGDVNGDGKINGQDLVRLRKHLNGENVVIGPGANVNGDAEGKVNGQDLIRLRKYLNGENVALGPSK